MNKQVLQCGGIGSENKVAHSARRTSYIGYLLIFNIQQVFPPTPVGVGVGGVCLLIRDMHLCGFESRAGHYISFSNFHTGATRTHLSVA